MLRKTLPCLIALILLLSGCLQEQALPTESSTTSSAPPATVPVAPSLTATARSLIVRKRPYLLLTGDPTSMKVCWQFYTPTASLIEWGMDEHYGAGSANVPEGSTDEISCAVLGDLRPATQYFYRISDGDGVFTGKFTSLPADDLEDLVFWGLSDTQENPQIHNAIAANILEEMSDDPARQTFIFNAGDIMAEASEESLHAMEFDAQWRNVVQLSSQVPIANAMGNHDGTKLFIKYFPYPYTDSLDWSFDYGPVHFVVIDLYSGVDENSPRWQWLRDDLSASTKKWKFILLHEPGWSAGPHEGNAAVREIIHPIAVRNGVSIVFAGHNHYYARAQVDGITYLTIGGGGGTLYDPEYGWPFIIIKIKANHYLRVEITGNTLAVYVMSIKQEILDQFQINR